MALAHKNISAGTSAGNDPLRVMVVDDAVVIRGLLTRWLGEDKAIEVVGSYRNGKLAVDDIEKINPDVVVLDIEMPEMDGMTALPLMLAKKRDLVVIMASTLTRRNAETSLKALSLGAADYVPKPETTSEVTTSIDFRRELIEKVKALGARARRMRGPVRTMRAETLAGRTATPSSRVSTPRQINTRDAFRGAPAPVKPGAARFVTRPYSSIRPRVLALGASTGGPQALQEVMRQVGTAMNEVPVLITQHMPPTFTAILAEHVGKAALRPAREGEDGEILRGGQIYVAPGGKHMIVEKEAGAVKLRLTDDPPINFCKPAIDPMFDSVAKAYGSSALAVVLTGMGHDGANGIRSIAAGGGSIVTQDEATSVVWGMPGAAAATGLCSDILPLSEIGPKLARVLKGKTR
ncbi:chemotaxis response regulator protein-glutamate methylesterase [Roseibium sp. RKSG952]|uniref:protein-glutamate methylesterase/protein-glutamine glutaminase n=1 Tax=Roseibium sp. RKSG952 TaxID=2529384 RepID=UPI0012BD63A3|nr:chemotaxis response regulator protein-glutamate methylesterase [Roseibium sp. RKSG952]MTH95821.1 chemotaxis response regulator protein-glutamate methylesterase [Roseibium sp. RKSG952]